VRRRTLDLQSKLSESAKSLQEADARIAKLQHDSSAEIDEAGRKITASEAVKKFLENQNATLQQQLKDALAQMGSLIDKKPGNGRHAGPVVKAAATVGRQLQELRRIPEEAGRDGVVATGAGETAQAT